MDKQKNIDVSKLVFEKEIAHGAFGKVYKGTYNDKMVAIKMIQEVKFTPTGNRVNMEKRWIWFLEEEHILNTVSHDAIVEYVGSHIPDCARKYGWKNARKSDPLPCLIFGLCEGGSLYTCIRRVRKRMQAYLKSLDQDPTMFDGPGLIEKDIIDVSIQLFGALAHLHGHGYVHRDVKSDNLLVDLEGKVKLSDFGLSIQIHKIKPGITGSLRWMAPEVILEKHYDEKIDIYSGGIVIWELVAAQIPYRYLAPEAAARTAALGHRPTIPSHCNPEIATIIELCWQDCPHLRPSAHTVVEWMEELKTTGKVHLSRESEITEISSDYNSGTALEIPEEVSNAEGDSTKSPNKVQRFFQRSRNSLDKLFNRT